MAQVLLPSYEKGLYPVLRRYKKREAVSKSGLKTKLIRYLEQYPEAKDTIMGIAQWWVSEKPDQVEAVLEELVEKGLIEKKNFSSLVLYSLSLAFKKGKRSDQTVWQRSTKPNKEGHNERENLGR